MKVFKSGQSLIEVLIAFAVSVLIGVALITATLAIQKTSQGARNQTQATKLAQEYIEDLRAIRDVSGYNSTAFPINNSTATAVCYTVTRGDPTNPTTWSLTSASCTGAPFAGEVVPVGTAPAPVVNFYRVVTTLSLDTITPSTRQKVSVDVNWNEGSGPRNVHTETVFSQWCSKTVTGTADAACP